MAFAGEGGDDYGGLFRESIRELAADLQGHALPLFVPAPNKCVVLLARAKPSRSTWAQEQ